MVFPVKLQGEEWGHFSMSARGKGIFAEAGMDEMDGMDTMDKFGEMLPSPSRPSSP